MTNSDRAGLDRNMVPHPDVRMIEDRVVGHRISFRRLPDPHFVRITTTQKSSASPDSSSLSQYSDWPAKTIRKLCREILALLPEE